MAQTLAVVDKTDEKVELQFTGTRIARSTANGSRWNPWSLT